ncbi:MAG: hypothetical protein A3F90_06170 [Deltaproteobacteria bacterium RIFCSPLOWO2_12_FULL_60_19]|nr:MAG: hypothetical protein A3F90_06170 [Deltaproteobacteria bacterium RIFCSPLOWO2_12_FULL_60_19]
MKSAYNRIQFRHFFREQVCPNTAPKGRVAGEQVSLAQAERVSVEQAWAATRCNQTRVARFLGIATKT